MTPAEEDDPKTDTFAFATAALEHNSHTTLLGFALIFAGTWLWVGLPQALVAFGVALCFSSVAFGVAHSLIRSFVRLGWSKRDDAH